MNVRKLPVAVVALLLVAACNEAPTAMPSAMEDQPVYNTGGGFGSGDRSETNYQSTEAPADSSDTGVTGGGFGSGD